MASSKPVSGQPLDRLWTILAISGIGLLAVRRSILVGSYPPGLDGAQWLALGRGLHGFGRSTDGAYAPLVPVLATLTESVAGPLSAVRLIAVLSGFVISLGIWLAARDALGTFWGLVVTAIVIPASALGEPMFFGGYPQQFALATGVLALWASCKYLVTAERKGLWLVGIAGFIAASTHHVYFPVFTLAILVAMGLWRSHGSARAGARRIRALVIALTPAFATFAVIAFTMMRAGYAPPLEASARLSIDAWAYGTRESPALWLLILLAAAVSLAVEWRTRATVAWLLSASLLLSAGPFFFVTGQPRLLPPVIIGAGLAAALGARRAAAFGSRTRMATLVTAFAVAVTLFVAADRASARFAEFYRVVDESLVRAAAAIDSDGGLGAVAVRQDRRGWPIGWWFEALLNRPVIVGSDQQWLAFPDEWEHARLAERLFDGGLDADAFRRRAALAGVGYLVIPKWDWIGWERWIHTPNFPVSTVYDDDRYLVLRITGSPQTRRISRRQWRNPSSSGCNLLEPARRR